MDNNNNNNAGRETLRRGGNALAALNPLVPCLTQPVKSLVERGIICRLAVIWTPTGVQVTARPGMALTVRNQLLYEESDYSVGHLIEEARKFGFVGKPTKGGAAKSAIPKEPSLPEKSLCARDFSPEKIAGLPARCEAIASKCGGGPLVGRVRSGGYQPTETISFRDWWEQAAPSDRLLALTEGKRRQEITPEMIANMANIRCPFRGDLDFVVAAVEEEETTES